jgi:hypothetical protein
MANNLFNKKHITEYTTYGSIAGLLYVLTVWYFLYRSNYQTPHVLFIGSIFFMFVIMIYALKLTKRRPDYYSTWGMIIAGQMTVAIGIAVSVIGSLVLCYFYLPQFMGSRESENLLRNVSGGLNKNNSGAFGLIFFTAVIENYGAGAFISAMIAYAIKPDQTRDRTPSIFEEPAERISNRGTPMNIEQRNKE